MKVKVSKKVLYRAIAVTTDADMLLAAAYEQTADQLNRGVKVLPTDFKPFWEVLQVGYEHIKNFEGSAAVDMHFVCWAAALEYMDTIKDVEIDDAFTSIIGFLGIEPRSASWYRIMSYHFLVRAEMMSAGIYS